jgi:hypothetical protein
MPHLNALDRSYEAVTVLGVNYDGAEGAELAQQRQALGVEFASITDPAAQLGTPRPVALPTTLVLNPQGEVVATLVMSAVLAAKMDATAPPPARRQSASRCRSLRCTSSKRASPIEVKAVAAIGGM